MLPLLTATLDLGKEGLSALFQCLEEAAGLATGMAVEPSPFHPRQDRIHPSPPYPPDPFPKHVHPQAIRRSIGKDILGYPNLDEGALLIHPHDLDDCLDLAGIQELPDHDTEQHDKEAHQYQSHALPPPCSLFGTAVAPLDFPVGLLNPVPFVWGHGCQLVSLARPGLRKECLGTHSRCLHKGCSHVSGCHQSTCGLSPTAGAQPWAS